MIDWNDARSIVNKVKYLRKTLKVIKSFGVLNVRGQILKTLNLLVLDDFYCVYHTDDKSITFQKYIESDKDFLKKKIQLDERFLKKISRHKRLLFLNSADIKVDGQYWLSVGNLYSNSLEVALFNNSLRDMMTEVEFASFIFQLSKNIDKQNLLKFCISWNLFTSSRECLDFFLKIFENKLFPKDIKYLGTRQKQIIFNLLKDEIDNNFQFVNLINNSSFKKQSNYTVSILNRFFKIVDNPNCVLNPCLVIILKKIVQYDNSTKGLLSFLINNNKKDNYLFEKQLLNTFKNQGVALLGKNDTIVDINIIPHRETIEDSVKYFDVKVVDIIDYFSYLISYNYLNGNNTFKEDIDKRLAVLLKKQFKHNVSVYQDNNQTVISVLHILQNDLMLFLKELSHLLEYLIASPRDEMLRRWNNSLTVQYNKAKAKYTYELVSINFD